MIKKSDFKPAWWLASPHLQTAWPTLTRRPIAISTTRERVELPDGDFVDLDWVAPKEQTMEYPPIVIVLHGLGGNINSPYAKGILKTISDSGWRGAFLHFRGASGIPNRLARSYHSGDTGDVDYIARMIREREPHSKLAAVGYSLGGNVLLKWLGETKADNPLEAAVAVSVPFELAKAANRMNKGISKGYQWYLLRQLRNFIIDKFKVTRHVIDMNEVPKLHNFWDFDTHVTAPLHGFKDAADYYYQSSSRPYIKHISIPTLIIHSADDPFMTREVIPEPEDLSRAVTLELSERGGHVGFVTGNIPGVAQYWLDHRIKNYLYDYLHPKLEPKVEKIPEQDKKTADVS